MSKVFLQKLRMVASEADDLLTSCDASDLLDGLEVARDFMFEAASMIEELDTDNESKQKRIDELESRLAQVEMERDARRWRTLQDTLIQANQNVIFVEMKKKPV